MLDHAHHFGPAVQIGGVVFCRYEGCGEPRVQTDRGWRELTSSQKLDVLAIQMEDLILVDAMSIIHGGNRLDKRGWFANATDRGVEKVRQHRGYGP